MEREKNVKSTMATALPEKGGQGKFARGKALEFIEENGDVSGDIIVKNDQEPAIKLLTHDVVEGRPEEKTLREEHQWRAIRAIAELRKDIRKLRGKSEPYLLVCKTDWGGR